MTSVLGTATLKMGNSAEMFVLHLFVYTTKLTVFEGTEMDIGTSKLMS